MKNTFSVRPSEKFLEWTGTFQKVVPSSRLEIPQWNYMFPFVPVPFTLPVPGPLRRPGDIGFCEQMEQLFPERNSNSNYRNFFWKTPLKCDYFTPAERNTRWVFFRGVLKYSFCATTIVNCKRKNQQWIDKARLFSKKASIHVIFFYKTLLVCISLRCSFPSSVDPPFDLSLNTGN